MDMLDKKGIIVIVCHGFRRKGMRKEQCSPDTLNAIVRGTYGSFVVFLEQRVRFNSLST